MLVFRLWLACIQPGVKGRQPTGLFLLMLNVPVNNFSVKSGQSHCFLDITGTFRGVNVSALCLLKDTTWGK